MRVRINKALRERGRELEKRRLVLVSGPGGAGKTALVRVWAEALERRGGRLAWLTLGPLHTDPAVFVADLIHAIREILPEPLEGGEPFGTALLRALPHRGETTPALYARLLEREIEGLGSPVVVCLDAFEHLAEAPATVAVVDLLLRAETEQLRLVLTSRGLQPPSTPRLLAEDAATTIEADALRLGPQELTAILRDEEVTLEAHQIERLLERSGGWAIAIRFAVRALVDSPEADRERMIANLPSDRNLFRYVANELIEGVDPQLIEAVEIASLLGPVPRKVLEEAIETSDAASLVDKAIDLGLLLDQGDRIAPHEMVADWIQLRLESRADESTRRELHRRLGDLLCRHGFEMTALRLFKESDLIDEMRRLLEDRAHAWANRGHYRMAEEALASLPEAIRQQSPGLLAAEGVIACSRDPDRAIENLKKAAAHYRDSGNRMAEFETLHELAIVASNSNRMEQIRDIYRYALSLRRVLLEPGPRAIFVMALGNGAYITGRYSLALRIHDRVPTHQMAPRERGGLTYARSSMFLHRGEWDRMIAEIEERSADPAQREHGPSFFAIQSRRAIALGLRGIDIEGCLATLEEASRFLAAAKHTLNRIYAEHYLAQLHFRLGDFDQAAAHLETALALSREIDALEIEASCAGLLARVQQRANRLADARQSAELSLSLLERPETWSERFSAAPLASAGAALGAMVHAELDDPVRALEACDTKRRRLINRDLPLTAHAVHLFVARIADRTGDARRCTRELSRGFRIYRDAQLVDLAAEIDRPLFDWAQVRARKEGVAIGAPRIEVLLPLSERELSLRIKSLGALEVSVADRTITNRGWKGMTARRLLSRLLVEDGRPISRERIEADLWPDATRTNARNNLRVALHRLRDVLEPRRRAREASRYVIVEGELLGLSEDALRGWDVRAWRAAIVDLEQAAEEADGGVAEEALERITLCAAGPFLPELLDDWCLDFRRSLEEDWRRAGCAACSQFLALGEFDVAERTALRLVDTHPDDQRIWELLTLSRLESGDRLGALRTLKDARSALARHLEIEPGDQLTRLEARIRSAG